MPTCDAKQLAHASANRLRTSKHYCLPIPLPTRHEIRVEQIDDITFQDAILEEIWVPQHLYSYLTQVR